MRLTTFFSSLVQGPWRAASLAGCLSLGLLAQNAQAWPDRTIRMIVPFSAGGTTDLLGRLVSEGIGASLGQPVVVINKGGAGGNLGASEVARAAPDGYTLLLGTPGTQVTNQFVYKSPGYDLVKDFAPVAFVARVANVVIASPTTQFKTMHDLIRAAKERPGELNWGTPGIGSSGHLALELIKQQTGIDIAHVPYKGASQARNDLLAGTIELGSDNLPTALAAIKAGQLVALGVSSTVPDPSLPDVLPIGEAVPGYELNSWFVVMAPAGTPEDVVNKLNTAVNTWLQEPKTQEKLAQLAAVPEVKTPEELKKFLQSELTKYESLTRSAGIQPQ